MNGQMRLASCQPPPKTVDSRSVGDGRCGGRDVRGRITLEGRGGVGDRSRKGKEGRLVKM